MAVRVYSYFFCLMTLVDNGLAAISVSEGQQPSHAYLAVNSNMAVFVRNRDRYFYITTSPYTANKTQCQLSFDLLGIDFVEKLAVSKEQQYGDTFTFAFIGTTSAPLSHYYLGIISITQDDSNSCILKDRQFWDMDWLGGSANGYALTMHPVSRFVYIIGNGYLCAVGVGLYEWVILHELNASNIFIKNIEATRDNYIFIGIYSQKIDTLVPELYVLQFDGWSTATLVLHFPMVNTGEIPRGQGAMVMSVHGSIDNATDFALAVGLPEIDTVLLYVLNPNNTLFAKIHRSPVKGVGFGQSVVITQDRMYGVLLASFFTRPWSTSQIQFYPVPPATGESPAIITPNPLIIFPNNQQAFCANQNADPPSCDIVDMIGWSAGFGVIVNSQNTKYGLLVPNTPPGYVSTAPTRLKSILITESKACPPGTEKNSVSFGPCVLCPPQTKNNGSSGIQCQECNESNSSVICFRGASTEIDRSQLTSYEQVQPYLDSSGSTEFDDILLHHVFKLSLPSSMRCLLVAPMFWGLLAIGIGLVLLLIMIVFSFIPKMERRRTLLKKVFVRLDIIGEGQLWFGGLLTLAIVTLIGFTCKFSMSFVRLYPVEHVSTDAHKTVSCDATILNAKFSSTLKLLSTLKRAEEKPIFDLLDKQDLTLTVQFISTSFQCSSVSVQENLDRGQIRPVSNFSCSYEHETNSLLISSPLPQHLVTLQFTLTGPFIVGGLRVCLSGPETQTHNGKYTVKRVDFCRFLYPSNQVLTVEPTVSIDLTKIINRTASAIDNSNVFSAIWLPILTMKSTLWDSHIYKSKEDEYRRSLSWKVALVVDLTQSTFYMQNVQEPIARGYEVVFKTILFSMLLLELFGLLFMIFKLLVIPFVRFIRRITRSSSAPEQGGNNVQTSISEDSHTEEAIASPTHLPA